MLMLAAGLRYELVAAGEHQRCEASSTCYGLSPPSTAQDRWWREAGSAPPRQSRGHFRLHHHRVRDLQEAPALDVADVGQPGRP